MKKNNLLYILIGVSTLSLVVSLYSLFKDIDINFDKSFSFISKSEEPHNGGLKEANNWLEWNGFQESMSEQEKAFMESNRQLNDYTNKVINDIENQDGVDIMELEKNKQDSFDKLLKKHSVEKLYHDFKSMLSNKKYKETIHELVLNSNDIKDINNIQELLYREIQKDYPDITYNISIDKFIDILDDDYMTSYIKSTKDTNKYTLPGGIIVDKEMKERVETEMEQYINTYPGTTKQEAAETILRTFMMERERGDGNIENDGYNNDPFGQYELGPGEYEEG